MDKKRKQSTHVTLSNLKRSRAEEMNAFSVARGKTICNNSSSNHYIDTSDRVVFTADSCCENLSRQFFLVRRQTCSHSLPAQQSPSLR